MNHFRVKALFGFKLVMFGVEVEEETEATLEEKKYSEDLFKPDRSRKLHSSASGNCHSKVEDNPKFSQIKTANP